MNTHLLALESHDDLISVKDRMSWAKTPRILLIWPKGEKIALRPLDLRILQRHARALGADLGLVTRDPRIRREAGGSRTGRYTLRLASTLFVNQAVLGIVRREGSRLEIALYLYDLRTRFLLRRLRRSVRAPPGRDPRGIDRLGAEVYEGVDLRGHVAAPEDRPPEQSGPTPLYGRWWFWTAIGVVVTAGVVTAVVIGGQEQSVPDGFVRLGGSVR